MEKITELESVVIEYASQDCQILTTVMSFRNHSIQSFIFGNYFESFDRMKKKTIKVLFVSAEFTLEKSEDT